MWLHQLNLTRKVTGDELNKQAIQQWSKLIWTGEMRQSIRPSFSDTYRKLVVKDFIIFNGIWSGVAVIFWFTGTAACLFRNLLDEGWMSINRSGQPRSQGGGARRLMV